MDIMVNGIQVNDAKELRRLMKEEKAKERKEKEERGRAIIIAQSNGYGIIGSGRKIQCLIGTAFEDMFNGTIRLDDIESYEGKAGNILLKLTDSNSRIGGVVINASGCIRALFIIQDTAINHWETWCPVGAFGSQYYLTYDCETLTSAIANRIIEKE